MRNVKVVVEYDGTDFYGFQYQPGVPTVQGELEKALLKIVKIPVTVYGAGRTDAGVHAKGQVFNFVTNSSVPTERFCVALNSVLPESIAAVDACEVEPGFHSRYSAVSRLYKYDILNRKYRSALDDRYCWHIRKLLDVDAIKDAASSLVGIHDYKAFTCVDNKCGSTIRHVSELIIEPEYEHIYIYIRANAFLRSMVRVMVGTMVEVGLARRAASSIVDILNGRERVAAGVTAPPQGLCLMQVEY